MMIGKKMIIATICAVFRDKVIQIIENDFEGYQGQMKIAGRIFEISIFEVKEEQ